MIRSLVLLALLVAAACLTQASPMSRMMQQQEDAAADLELSSFLEQAITADVAFESELATHVGDSLEVEAESNSWIAPLIVETQNPKPRGDGVVFRGGIKEQEGANFTKSAKDGSTLAPLDPFGMMEQHNKRKAWQQKRRQAEIDRQTKKTYAKRTAMRTKLRLAAEKREKAEAAEEAKRVAKLVAKKSETEIDLMEVAAEAEAETETETEAEAETESESESELDSEAESDAAQESESDAEAETDAEAESEDAATAESEDADAALIESTNSGETELRPSAHVTIGREELADETFDNGGGRAVFARRARDAQITRFEKVGKSSGGQAVVNGVTKLPCGKEITDKGLFAASISEHLQATVEAANPEAPQWVDDNVDVIKKLPVSPEFVVPMEADEYGDMPAQ